jgi:hypothetical protein
MFNSIARHRANAFAAQQQHYCYCHFPASLITQLLANGAAHITAPLVLNRRR